MPPEQESVLAQGKVPVPAESVGHRLDVFVAACAQVTRSRAAQLIEEGRVTIDGRAATKPGLKLALGALVGWQIPPPRPLELTPEPLPLTILYEDADLAVVYKPHGMVVHPAAGNAQGTLVHALLYHLHDLSGIGGVARPGIVHRLDKDTSGLLLVAKHDAAHQALSAQLKARSMCKLYAALARGGFAQDSGRIEAPIGRDPRDRKRMAVIPEGRDALTEYRVAGRVGQDSLLCVHLVTGRTHQIRVHLRSSGHPLVGDPLYGGKRADGVTRLLLHAYRLTFTQPTSGLRITVTAPWPADFLQNLQKLSGPGGAEQLQQTLHDFETICESF